MIWLSQWRAKKSSILTLLVVVATVAVYPVQIVEGLGRVLAEVSSGAPRRALVGGEGGAVGEGALGAGAGKSRRRRRKRNWGLIKIMI